MLEIRLLGSPQVTVDTVPVEVDTRKAIAMLAYLAVEQSADREALASLFWAESSPERSRATLRRTLSSLRGGIGADWIRADRNRVTIAEGFVCDVHRFTTEIEETTHHDHDPSDVCSRCIPHLAMAADLYRGDFLGAFSVRDAPDFENWARTVAESLRLQAGDALRRLAMAHASSGDYTAAVVAAARWIKLDELHEPAHRLLMLLRAWDGDRAGSIQAYRDCVAVLDRELGVAPLEETTELYEAILDEDLPPAPGLRRPVRTHHVAVAPPPSAIIGRDEEARAVRDVIATIEAPGRLLVVSGASWMGKTRLIEHIVDVAAELGVATVSGRAFRPESMLPYGVATQLLEAILADWDDSDLPVAEWVLAELARLSPKLAPVANSNETADLGQLRLREAFGELVGAAADDRPIVVTIDDAQWMDSASATLISYVQRRSQQLRMLLVVSTRDVESLHPAMREVAEEADHSIALGPLTASDLSAQPPDIDTTAIITATGGIPLLVKQALESNAVTPDAASVAKYMESRRRRLSDLADQVMAAAAVLDGMCDAQLLRDTSGRTEDEVVDAVEELVSAGLLREYSDGKLGFTLEALEAATYESTSLIRRRLLHRRAADALQAKPRSRTDAILATAAAEHLRDAGSDEAAEWYLLAGDLSRGVFAHDEAVTAYETAIALGHSDHGGIRLALGELAMARGDYETAMRELRAAVSQSTGATLATVEHRTGNLHRMLGRFDLAEESFVRAEQEHPNPSELYADWALLRHRLGDAEEAITMANRALQVAEETDDRNRARGLNILGVVTPDSDAAMAHIDEALELAGSVEPARMAALNNKAHLLGGEGHSDAAAELVNEAIEIAAKAGYRHQEAALLNHLADLHHQSGRESDAQAALREAVTIFADIDSGEWQPEVWLLRQW
jgi:DNA-binding SARP family transcriptional activator/tetratricopeptide (TPR) repeat protein